MYGPTTHTHVCVCVSSLRRDTNRIRIIWCALRAAPERCPSGAKRRPRTNILGASGGPPPHPKVLRALIPIEFRWTSRATRTCIPSSPACQGRIAQVHLRADVRAIVRACLLDEEEFCVCSSFCIPRFAYKPARLSLLAWGARVIDDSDFAEFGPNPALRNK